jgi:hypothetical protein
LLTQWLQFAMLLWPDACSTLFRPRSRASVVRQPERPRRIVVYARVRRVPPHQQRQRTRWRSTPAVALRSRAGATRRKLEQELPRDERQGELDTQSLEPHHAA